MQKVQFKIKLFIQAAKASSAPPIGPILGQYRLNLVEFCKDFNEQTVDWDDSIVLPIIIICYINNSLEYIIKSPTTTHLLRAILETEHSINDSKQSSLCTVQQIYELAIAKYSSTTDSEYIYKSVKMICGTLKTMRIRIIR
jgi:large subunit ribosomal protein L11